jgi:translation initiation factor IF-1
MPDPTIHALGVLCERLRDVLYRADLPNGKRILAHLSKPLADRKVEFEPGTRVILELTPYDFDSARILREATAEEKE